VCFVSGFAARDDELSHLFDRSFFLHVEADELRRRLLTRTNAPFANASRAVREAQVQRVLPNLAALEQRWLARGIEIVSSKQPLPKVVDDILRRCDRPLRYSR
jgi:hypothetical protein